MTGFVTGFISAAIVLTVIACLWIFLPLFKNRGQKAGQVNQMHANLAVLRDQLMELDSDYATGAIGQAEFTEAKMELERRTLEESRHVQESSVTAVAYQRPSLVWVAAGSLAMLGLAGAFYSAVGTPSAFDPKVAVMSAEGRDPHDFTVEQLDQMLNDFAAKMEKQPDNIEGWLTLARAYYQVGKQPEALATYEKVLVKAPDNPDVLADYADILAIAQNGQLDGRPMELVERALKLSPTHWKALGLAGTYAFEQQDYAKAEAYWEKMKETAPAGSDVAASIDGSIAEARAKSGSSSGMPPPKAPEKMMGGTPPTMPPPSMGMGASAMGAQGTAQAPAAASTAKVSGTVSLSPAMKAQVSPDDMVLIFVRRAEGSPTPIALLRTTVRDLPAKFDLDDSYVMMPSMSLATVGDVVVGARISKGGKAMPQPGDIEGFSSPVKVGATGVVVTLDTVRK